MLCRLTSFVIRKDHLPLTKSCDAHHLHGVPYSTKPCVNVEERHNSRYLLITAARHGEGHKYAAVKLSVS